MAMTYAELGRLIAIAETRLSPHSRTPAYQAFLSQMVNLTTQDCREWQSSAVEVSADVVKFWLDAYREAEHPEPRCLEYTKVLWHHIYVGLAMHALILRDHSPVAIGPLVLAAVDSVLESLAEKPKPEPEPETESEEPASTTRDDDELRKRYRDRARRRQYVSVSQDGQVNLDYDGGAWVQAEVWVAREDLIS